MTSILLLCGVCSGPCLVGSVPFVVRDGDHNRRRTRIACSITRLYNDRVVTPLSGLLGER
jgi:hypothetical protein